MDDGHTEASSTMDYISYIAVGAVAVVLLLGLVNMFRGGSANTSQKLMRWRVGLQALAILVLMLTLYFTQR
jgi:hypothetical protein